MTVESTPCPSPASHRFPIPDPTALTTAALHREVGTLRDAFGARLDAADSAAASLNRERTEQFGALKELMGERILGLTKLVDEKFASTERQRIEQKNDTKQAVDAALTAQKEAVKEQTTASDRSIAKSEAATGKQLEQQKATTDTAVDGLRRSIDEQKDRSAEDVRNLRQSIVDVAAVANAAANQRIGAKDDRTAIYAVISVVGVVVGILIALAAFLATRPGV